MSSTKPRGRGQRSSWRKRRAGSRGRARGEGLGAAGKFALAEKSARWGNFHPAHKGRRGSGENSLPSRWGKVICACKCLEPSDSRRLLGPSLGERLHPADSSVHAELRPELARAAVLSVTKPWETYNAKVVKCSPNWLPQPSPVGNEGPDVDKRQLGVPDVREADTLLRK